ncbi:hypothetical protein KDD30_05380 [Photobacterium sp. GJ3]|uniref:hypothetical protein n=1 Tax=Photobacterium sp. GJ3 TaxID=2829502 RepID=UPI001B8D7547|nr:hypothetical protein [Photobacterium sp. GJ3]QUJ68547.1 hypothetical protein KDD30_05380 [Photobacterium sp. GJ3]
MGFSSFAASLEYEPAQDLILGENVQELHIVDINGDHRKDLVWVTTTGDVRYQLKRNDSKATLSNLPGTRWRLEYRNDKGIKFIDFTSSGGVMTTSSNVVYKINQLMMTENNELSFCTDASSGMSQTDCEWVYRVTDIQPNTMTGVDDRTGLLWDAYKLVQ